MSGHGTPGPALAVDFGTSYSSAALVWQGQVRPVKEPFSRSFSFTSSVCLVDGVLEVGTAAERRKRRFPMRYRDEFKRLLGQDAPIWLGEEAYQAEQLAAAVIGRLREEAVKLLAGEPLTTAVVTVPASYGKNRRDLMLAAARQAGFTSVDLLDEPVAAAFAPATGPALKQGDLVLVYDFGGGTFDAALVAVEPDGPRVLGQAGLGECGGRDIDRLLYADIQARGGERLGALLETEPDAGEDARLATLRARLELLEFARDVKHHLTDAREVSDFYVVDYEIDRDRFAELAGPLVESTLECCRALLSGSSREAGDLTAVLLVGGSTRMPLIAEAVERALGRPVRTAEDPELAVAVGAAHWQLSRSGSAEPAGSAAEQPAAELVEEYLRKQAGSRPKPAGAKPAGAKPGAGAGKAKPAAAKRRTTKKPAAFSDWDRLHAALRAGQSDTADAICKALIRTHARTERIDSRAAAQRIPTWLIRAMKDAWAVHGVALRDRDWVRLSGDMTEYVAWYRFQTFLRERIEEA